jgi:hypothetical protein
MANWIKKILAVFFLTLLIWAWAFLSLETTLSHTASLQVAPVAVSDYLVTFDGAEDSYDNLQLRFKGTPAKISEMLQRYRSETLTFYYDPKEFGHTRSGKHTIDVSEFIRQNPKIREYALTLEWCRPEKLDVNVEKLEKKLLVVQCVDETGGSIKPDTIEPAQVEIFVRSGYSGSAMVMLTPQQSERAKKLPISVKPYAEIAPGKRRYAEEPVQVTLSASEKLEPMVIQPAIGYVVNPAMTGKFKIELLNETELKTITNIRFTEKAYEAYKKQKYQFLIEIRDGDESLPEIPPRAVIYNFPQEYVKSGQIEAPNPPHQAQLKLTPIVSPAAPAAVAVPLQ